VSKLTPMMRQYKKIKAEHEGAVLLFRMGDFYETFFEDAKIASRVLGLALTTRDRGTDNPVPLAGIPYHALDSYLARLVRAGYDVAICDQVEDPKKSKGLVRRAVTEVITPGTILETSMLDERRPNFLASVAVGASGAGLARVDLSTGEFVVAEHAADGLRRELLRTGAAELLVAETEAARKPLDGVLPDLPDVAIRRLPDWEFGLDQARTALREHFGVANLDGFGVAGMGQGLRAAGAALRYLRDLKRRDLSQITKITKLERAEHMVLDETTQRNLELVEPLERGMASATLLAVLDETVTAMGARLLRQWVLFPLMSPAAVNRRLDAVEAFAGDRPGADRLASTLSELCDLERVVGRAAVGHAGPRELVALRRSIELLPDIAARLRGFGSDALDAIAGCVPELADVATLVRESIIDDPPAGLARGGVIRDGFDAALDEVRGVAREGKGWVGRLQTSERETTGIPTLKVGYNKVFGYYIEVTKPHLDLVPERYQRKQTLVNAERFVTPELKERESRILTAEEDTVRMEREHFERIREKVGAAAARVQEAARATATADALLSFARVSVDHRYTRPLVDDSAAIEIREGRHPVVERLLEGDAFVPNDTEIDTEARQILLITGPNMAGKSTYLRQVGLVVIMAQIGCFVPARSARIGVVDRIFTRIGATDALARGRSTFLVEMGETANILHNATSRSLILLDEIGRGTSTFDGLSIAWAVTEYLHRSEEARPKTLFATHYHELTELEELLPRLRNMNVLVRETEDSIVFLRKVVPGAADQSYGIEVAKLAGMPPEVIVRAREILGNLEESQYTAEARPRLAGGSHGPLGSDEDQLTLFGGVPSEVEREIDDLELTTMTPIEAIEKLDELQRRVRRGKQDPDTP